MSDREAGLHSEHMKGQAQFAYFLLGLAASAIAFAVHETTGKSLADTPWPMILGVCLWGLSFMAGCFGLNKRQEGIRINILYLRAVRRLSAVDLQHPTIRSIEDDTQKALSLPRTRFDFQLWAFFLGAVAYVTGHAMEMAVTPTKSVSKSVTVPQSARPMPIAVSTANK